LLGNDLQPNNCQAKPTRLFANPSLELIMPQPQNVTIKRFIIDSACRIIANRLISVVPSSNRRFSIRPSGNDAVAQSVNTEIPVRSLVTLDYPHTQEWHHRGLTAADWTAHGFRLKPFGLGNLEVRNYFASR
jgi:hypothetical protein